MPSTRDLAGQQTTCSPVDSVLQPQFWSQGLVAKIGLVQSKQALHAPLVPVYQLLRLEQSLSSTIMY